MPELENGAIIIGRCYQGSRNKSSGTLRPGVMMQSYESIFWEKGWAHQKYYGWTVIHDARAMKVLYKKRGPLSRYLVLSAGLSADEVAGRLTKLGVFGPLNEIILHDFTATSREARLLANKRFVHANKQKRILNIATFAIDLSVAEETILQRMKADYRRKLKRARDQGIVVEVDQHPSPEQIANFMAWYKQMAVKNGLQVPDEGALSTMFRNGDLLLFTARNGSEVQNLLMTYVAGDKAIFLYGVGGEKRNDGVGQYLQWMAMLHLKALGIAWYDLGGVATIDDANGIYRFKKGFGGELILLGSEYMHTPVLVKALYGCVNTLKKIRVNRRVAAT